MLFFDLLFYGYIKRSFDRKWKGHFYVLKGFAFALFLNFTTIYLLLKQANVLAINDDTDAWGFGVSGTLGAVITYVLDKRKDIIIVKYKNRDFQDLPLWWIGHYVFSTVLFIVVAIR